MITYDGAEYPGEDFDPPTQINIGKFSPGMSMLPVVQRSTTKFENGGRVLGSSISGANNNFKNSIISLKYNDNSYTYSTLVCDIQDTVFLKNYRSWIPASFETGIYQDVLTVVNTPYYVGNQVDFAKVVATDNTNEFLFRVGDCASEDVFALSELNPDGIPGHVGEIEIPFIPFRGESLPVYYLPNVATDFGAFVYKKEIPDFFIASRFVENVFLYPIKGLELFRPLDSIHNTNIYYRNYSIVLGGDIPEVNPNLYDIKHINFEKLNNNSYVDEKLMEFQQRTQGSTFKHKQANGVEVTLVQTANSNDSIKFRSFVNLIPSGSEKAAVPYFFTPEFNEIRIAPYFFDTRERDVTNQTYSSYYTFEEGIQSSREAVDNRFGGYQRQVVLEDKHEMTFYPGIFLYTKFPPYYSLKGQRTVDSIKIKRNQSLTSALAFGETLFVINDVAFGPGLGYSLEEDSQNSEGGVEGPTNTPINTDNFSGLRYPVATNTDIINFSYLCGAYPKADFVDYFNSWGCESSVLHEEFDPKILALLDTGISKSGIYSRWENLRDGYYSSMWRDLF